MYNYPPKDYYQYSSQFQIVICAELGCVTLCMAVWMSARRENSREISVHTVLMLSNLILHPDLRVFVTVDIRPHR